MLKRVLIGIFALWTSIALAAPAAVNLGIANNTTTNSNVVITTANASAVGNTILVAFTKTDTLTACSSHLITDSASNTYTFLDTIGLNNNTANGSICVFRVYNAASLSSSSTITIAPSGGTLGFVTATALSISGVTSSPPDGTNKGGFSGGLCDTASGAGITPTVNGDMIVGFCGWSLAGTTTSDFTQDSTVAWASPPTVNAYTANSIGIGGGSFVQLTAANIEYAPSVLGLTGEFMIALKASGGGGATSDQSLPLTGFGN